MPLALEAGLLKSLSAAGSAHVVPSASYLTPAAVEIIKSTLVVHETFNLAQMLQGENVPGSVVKLKELISQEGAEAPCLLSILDLEWMRNSSRRAKIDDLWPRRAIKPLARRCATTCSSCWAS